MIYIKILDKYQLYSDANKIQRNSSNNSLHLEN